MPPELTLNNSETLHWSQSSYFLQLTLNIEHIVQQYLFLKLNTKHIVKRALMSNLSKQHIAPLALLLCCFWT